MKERLEQLTLSEFVELLCGDTGVLLDRKESAKAEELAMATRNIVLEYRSIADSAGTGSFYKHAEDWVKSRINMIIFTMCSNLVSLDQYGRAREVLVDYGLPAAKWTNARVKGIIQAKLAQAQREVAELEAENEQMNAERENIRGQFDALTASLMAHFKFQIDPATIKASLYANLVARYNREIKAQMAALNKK